MNRIPHSVQPERPEDDIVPPTTEIILDYLPSDLQPDGPVENGIADTENQQIQHHYERGRFRNHQQSEVRRTQRHSDHSHVMRELWPLDHQLPPAPEDVLDVQCSQMHRGRRVDSSMYWPTDHALPPVSEDARSYRIPAHPRLRSMLSESEHSLRMSQIEEIYLSSRLQSPSLDRLVTRTTELQPLGLEVARTTEPGSLRRAFARMTELHSLGREGARTTELGDDLDDAPPPAYASPPAYGSWKLE